MPDGVARRATLAFDTLMARFDHTNLSIYHVSEVGMARLDDYKSQR